MYTNAGMLSMMTFSNIKANYEGLREVLDKVENGHLLMTDVAYENHKRWEEDINAYFIRTAEQRGLTNVRNDTMNF